MKKMKKYEIFGIKVPIALGRMFLKKAKINFFFFFDNMPRSNI